MFCGQGGPFALEHVIADWAGKAIVGLYEDDVEIQHMNRRGEAADDPEATWRTKVMNQGTRQICRRCNETWMSRLEADTKPILLPIITGQKPTSLSPQSARTVAVWAYKTFLVWELLRRTPRAVPPEEYHRFFRRPLPPRQTRIWLGTYHAEVLGGRGDRLSAYFRQRIKLPSDVEDLLFGKGNGYVVNFNVYCAVFQIFGHFADKRVELASPRPDLLEQIWPPTGATVSWPNPRCFTDQSIRELTVKVKRGGVRVLEDGSVLFDR